MNKEQIVEILTNRLLERGPDMQSLTVHKIESIADEIMALHKKHVVETILPEYDEYLKRHKTTMEAHVEVPIHLGSFTEGWKQGVEATRYAVAREVLDEFNADDPCLDCSDIGELYTWLDQ